MKRLINLPKFRGNQLRARLVSLSLNVIFFATTHHEPWWSASAAPTWPLESSSVLSLRSKMFYTLFTYFASGIMNVLHFRILPQTLLKALCDVLYMYYISRTSLVAQMVKCLPTMQETQVQSPGREDPLEKEMGTHSSALAWKIP